MCRNGGKGKTLPCVLGSKVTFEKTHNEDEQAVQSHEGSILGTVEGITQAFQDQAQYFGVTSECK